MDCRLYDDPGLFTRDVGPFLAGREAENTIVTGAALRCRDEPFAGAVMAAVRDRERVRFAAVMTPPLNLVLAAGDPAAVPVLARALLDADAALPGVVGPRALADAFAVFWSGRRGVGTELEHDLLLCRAERIGSVPAVPGRLRSATAADLDLLADWHVRFVREARLSPHEPPRAREFVQARIARGEVFVWVHDRRVVSVAAFVPTTPAGDAGRINNVFTPASERNRGYATACVAAVGRRLLAARWRYGLIFADADNPITNHIYPKIGFEVLGTYRSLAFR